MAAKPTAATENNVPALDQTNDFNTKLSAADERKFQSWAASAGKSGDLRDYDLRGWWKKNGTQDDRGHMTDEFKKPNHPTFSEESQYSTAKMKGGKWGGEDSAPTFTPSEANLKNMTADELKSYFQRVEPNASLVLPDSEPASDAAPDAATKRYGK